jgi:hypothetical protein
MEMDVIAKTSNQVNIIGNIDFLNTIKDVLFDNGILISNICKKHPEVKVIVMSYIYVRKQKL